MDFFYLAGGAAVLLMTFLLHRFGNAWIDRLYASHRDILTFPLAVKERGRLRRFLLPLAFLFCGARAVYIASSPVELFFLLFAAAFLLLMTATDFEQYCLFDAMMLPFAAGGLLLSLLQLPLLTDRLIAAAIGGVAFLVLAILSRGALGGGDVKLIASLGLWLGRDALLFVTMAGIVLGGLAALLLMLPQEAQERLRLWPVLCAHCAYSLPDAERVTGDFSRSLSHRRIPFMRTYSKTAYKEKSFDRWLFAVYDYCNSIPHAMTGIK